MKTAVILFGLLATTGVGVSAKAAGPSPLLPGGSANAPVNVNADKLEYFSKQDKAVYSGHVVARQGGGSLRASRLTIFFTQAGPTAIGAHDPAMSANAGSQVRRMEAAGPVTIVQKDQIGTGDSGVYDRAQNKIFLNGDVSLTQGPNVVKGDRLIYDLGTGRAQVVGRVTSLFVTGGNVRPERAPQALRAAARPRQGPGR